jgi:hypothetical protein
MGADQVIQLLTSDFRTISTFRLGCPEMVMKALIPSRFYIVNPLRHVIAACSLRDHRIGSSRNFACNPAQCITWRDVLGPHPGHHSLGHLAAKTLWVTHWVLLTLHARLKSAGGLGQRRQESSSASPRRRLSGSFGVARLETEARDLPFWSRPNTISEVEL